MNIPRRAVGNIALAVFQNLRGFAGHGHGQLLLALAFVPVQAVYLWQGDHHPQSTPARNDCCLVDWVAFRQSHAYHRVAGLVIGGFFLLLGGQNHRAPLCPHHHFVLSVFKIFHGDKATADTRCHQGRLIDKVGKVGTGKARRPPRNDAQVYVGP